MYRHISSVSRMLCCALLAAFALGAVSGCSWMGRTAGKAQAKVERKADAVEQGYHQGYNEEKAKSSQAKE